MWVIVVIIGLPLIGILGAVFYKVATQKEPERVVRNENDEIDALRKRAGLLQKEYPAIANSGSDAKKRAFQERLQDFMMDFDGVMKPYMDEDGYLRDEYRGYRKITAPIVQMSVDLSRQTGFGLDD